MTQATAAVPRNNVGETPRSHVAERDQALSKESLARQYHAVQRAVGDNAGLEAACFTISSLLEPVIQTTLQALYKLQPSEAAMVNQVAVALIDAGSKRPKLIAELRAALDRVTP